MTNTNIYWLNDDDCSALGWHLINLNFISPPTIERELESCVELSSTFTGRQPAEHQRERQLGAPERASAQSTSSLRERPSTTVLSPETESVTSRERPPSTIQSPERERELERPARNTSRPQRKLERTAQEHIQHQRPGSRASESVQLGNITATGIN